MTYRLKSKFRIASVIFQLNLVNAGYQKWYTRQSLAMLRALPPPAYLTVILERVKGRSNDILSSPHYSEQRPLTCHIAVEVPC